MLVNIVCFCSLFLLIGGHNPETQVPSLNSSPQPRKCCFGRDVYSVKERKCLSRHRLERDEIGPLAEFQCPPQSHQYYYNGSVSLSADNTFREPRFNSILHPHEFCLDDTDEGSQMMLYCIQSIRLVKCCPPGYAMNASSIGQCISHTSPLHIDMMLRGRPAQMVYKNETVLKCQVDYNIFQPDTFRDNMFFIQPSGSLFVPGAPYNAIRNITEYCIDNAIDSEDRPHVTAVMCLPKTLYVMRFLYRVVLPYFHYLSASLSFMTTVVYLLLPRLRDSLHGRTFICFLLCMIIVQLEYGILYIMDYVAHTWCIARTFAVNYFRLAASAWITVMGFDTWRKLIHPRAYTKRQELILYLWYSLYAWSVPLILVVTAEIYGSIHFKGSTAPACWLGGPPGVVILHLTTTPNIVLVTGNLFFFIPSAIKVYRSAGMVSKMSVRHDSGKTLNSIERDRYHSIFRLFILTEFYTIPRLIHLFSDVSSASPYPLMISVWIYQLLGPCVFFGFICKRAILDDLKALAKRLLLISPRIPRIWRSQSYSFSSSSLKSLSTQESSQISADSKCQINLGYEE